LLKESYRVNKHELVNIVIKYGLNLRILFTLSSDSYDEFNELNYKKISTDMLGLLHKIDISLQK